MRTWTDLLLSWGPMLLFVGIWVYFMKRNPWIPSRVLDRRRCDRTDCGCARETLVLSQSVTIGAMQAKMDGPPIRADSRDHVAVLG
jgi:hypothetical protein